uniref:Variant surface glycoprotein 1125.1421 n=1 Tax=Trypanosoma brucei TaxID=5691 RepID=A0A1J0R4P9_9TRYP|nr:variant surface glycoprotein 1125.1421 [Trypanosoma brucei]
MCGIKYCVVLFALVLRTSISGEGKIVNEDEFGALCSMINLAQAELRKIKEVRETIKGTIRIGARCLELTGGRVLDTICEGENSRNCENRRTFWKKAESSSNKKIAGDGLLDRQTEEMIRKIGGEAADLYEDVTRKRWVPFANALEEKINEALYGVPWRPEEIRENTTDRKQLCQQEISRNAVHYPPASLSRDLLCVCAIDLESVRKHRLCCEFCGYEDNREVWKPNKDSWERWNFLRAHCAFLGEPKEDFEKLARTFRRLINQQHNTPIGVMYILEYQKRNSFWSLGLSSRGPMGPGVHYVLMGKEKTTDDIPWLKLLREVTMEMGQPAQDNVQEGEFTEALEKLEQDLEKLIQTK